jgi:hypothetical protein
VSDVDPVEEPPEYNAWAITAVCCGILGLFVLQVFLAPVTIVISAIGYHFTEGDPWARKLTYVGYVLGIVDGLVWLVLESVFHVRLFPL